MSQNSRFQFLLSLRRYITDLFNLHEDSAQEEQTIAEIRKNIVFRGANLWILIFAVFIASIGLNVNSTAVIIGAMLISPLMGPIMGIGLGAGINDLGLLKKSLKNLAEAVLISVLTSTIYFWITPLYEAQSELLARTTPTVWDVLIALFGGLAGIVAGSRREKSNAIPGVAIATALMPPLCTAGYGLAIGNWQYFFGAFYLFFINSVFISVSTFLIVRFLGYKKIQFENTGTERKVRKIITLFVVITILPSIYLAYGLVKDSIFDQNVRRYLKAEFEMENTKLIHHEIFKNDNGNTLEITLIGNYLDSAKIADLINRKNKYQLENTKVQVVQGSSIEDSKTVMQRVTENIRTNVIEELYKQNREILTDKDKTIRFLEQEMMKHSITTYPVNEITAELQVYYPGITKTAMGRLIDSAGDTINLTIIHSNKTLTKNDQKKINEWLSLRLKTENLITRFD